ncbi:hypothetical protein ACLKA6_019117 [Drosophila palustris]
MHILSSSSMSTAFSIKEITKFKMPGWMSTECNHLPKVDNDGSGNPFLIKWRYARGPAAWRHMALDISSRFH